MTRKALIVPVLSLIALVFAAGCYAQSTADKLPILSDDSVWTSVAVKDLRVLMPAKAFEVKDEATGEVQSIHALTTTGTFSVVIKQLDKQLDPRNTETIVDQIAVTALTARTQLIEKHDVEYEGTRGEQVTYLEDGNRMFARIFLLNDRLIVMSASFKSSDYCPEFEVLVDRFFDSIRVKVPLLVA
ncbi:MAG: hypothetical protein ACJ73D_08240 [Pyrinomonadaceae bacterium]